MEKATPVIKTCSLYCLRSSCLILPLDPDLTGRESVVGLAQSHTTFNQLTRRGQLALHLTGTEMLSVKKESCGDGRVATQQLLDGAVSCSYGSARRRLRILVSPTEKEAIRSSAAP